MSRTPRRERETIDVVGGGFSGMALAWYLTRLGARVRLFERSHRLGGLIQTLRTPYGVVERAASGMLCSRDVQELFSDLELKLTPSFKKFPRRYIYRGTPSALPLRGLEWLKMIKLIKEKLGGFSGLRPMAGESLFQWSARNWGEGLARGVIEPVFQGVFAAPSDLLSAELTLRGLFSPLAKSSGPKGTVAPMGGMSELIERWTVQLLKAGVDIHLGSTWRDDGRAQKVALCLAPRECSKYLQADGSEFVEELSALPRVGLVSLTAFFPISGRELRGFGVLAPRSEGVNSVGVLFNSDIFWERGYGYRSETYIFEEAWDSKSDDELLASALKDRERVQRGDSNPVGYQITRRKGALPLYGLELEKFLRKHPLSHGRYHLSGNSFGELGLARILRKAKDLSQEWMTDGK